MRNSVGLSLLLLAWSAPLALAQDNGGTAAAQADAMAMTCGELSGLDEATQSAAIHFVAGYGDGMRAAIAAVGTGTEEGVAEAQEQAGSAAAGMSASGFSLDTNAVLAACSESPDLPLAGVIEVERGAVPPDLDPTDEDPAAEGEDGQDVGSGNSTVE